MRRLDRVTNLDDDSRGFFAWQRRVALRVPFQDLTGCPLDGEEMQSGARFARFDRTDDVRMLDTSAELRLAKKTRDRRPVLTQLFAQHFECCDPMLGMIGTIDGRGSTLSDH